VKRSRAFIPGCRLLRHLRESALAGYVALVVSGLLLGCHRQPVVVVVGGGPAGLAAAIEASSAGRVVLFEKEESLGGMVRYASGVTAIPEIGGLAAWDAEAGGRNSARDRYARDVESEVVAWTEGLGVRWKASTRAVQSGVSFLVPEGRGANLSRALILEVEARGVDVHLRTRVTRIERSHEGRYRVFTESSSDESFQADALVLATGGYMGNTAMVQERMDLAGAPLLRGSPATVDGNGVGLAVSLGGHERSPAAIELYAHGIPDGRDPTSALMLMRCAAAWPIDGNGVYMPEVRSSRGDSGRHLLERSGGRGWLVVDAASRHSVEVIDTHAGEVWGLDDAPLTPAAEAPDLASLARLLGLPPSSLSAGLAAEGAPTDIDHPLHQTGPYAAFPLELTTAKGLTGIETDPDGRVLGADDAPIEGLYAAGELMAFGHPYDGVTLDSTMIAGALLTGRVAGRAVARDLR
jgi:fumarate reductase flavoprotein subunit